MTIFVVVAVFGLAVGFAKSKWLPKSPHSAGVSETAPPIELAVDVDQPEG